MFRRLIVLALAAATLAGCGAPPVGVSTGATALRAEALAGGLSGKVKRLYATTFDLYDADDDGRWTAQDFDLPEDRFLNLFHKEDADDDKAVTKAEFYTPDEHTDMMLYIEARGGVTAQTLNGRVSFAKAWEVLDTYLAPYLNKGDRKRVIEKAFKAADADDTGYLKTEELEYAYAILLAKAEEKRIEKAVNRSKGQPDAPIGEDPAPWVKKKR